MAQKKIKKNYVSHLVYQGKVFEEKDLLSMFEEKYVELSHNQTKFMQLMNFLEIVQSCGGIDECTKKNIKKENRIRSKDQKMYILDLSGMDLQSLKNIETIMQEFGLNNLQVRKIRASDNNLTYIDWEHLFETFPQCKTFNFSNNQLSDLQGDFWKALFDRSQKSSFMIVTKVDLSGNKISNLSLTKETCALYSAIQNCTVNLHNNLITSDNKLAINRALQAQGIAKLAYFIKYNSLTVYQLSLLFTNLLPYSYLTGVLLPYSYLTGVFNKAFLNVSLQCLFVYCVSGKRSWFGQLDDFCYALFPNSAVSIISKFAQFIGYQLPNTLCIPLKIVFILLQTRLIHVISLSRNLLRNQNSPLKIDLEEKVHNEHQ
jgi:hypothetical protein